MSQTVPDHSDLPSEEHETHDDLLSEIGRLRAEIAETTVATREESEASVADYTSDLENEEKRHIESVKSCKTTFQNAIQDADTKHDHALRNAKQTYSNSIKKIDEDADTMRKRIQEKATSNVRTAKAALEEASWVAETVFEANEDRPRTEYEGFRSRVETALQEIDSLQKRVDRELRRYWQPRPRVAEPTENEYAAAEARPDKTVLMQVAVMAKSFERFRQLPIARLFRGPIMVLPAIVFICIGSFIAYTIDSTDTQFSFLLGGGIGLAVFLPFMIALYAFARREVRVAYQPISKAANLARHAGRLAIEEAHKSRIDIETRLVKDRERDISKAKERFEPLIGDSRRKAEDRLEEINRRVPILKSNADEARKKAISQAKTLHEQQQINAKEEQATSLESENALHKDLAKEVETKAKERWDRLEKRWRSVIQEDTQRLTEIQQQLQDIFPGWSDPRWKAWSPADSPPAAIPFGSIHFDRNDVEDGPPTDARLSLEIPTVFEIPAIVALPRRASLAIDVDADHRDQGMNILRAVMLRILASVPPGKAKFTIIDPIGLGQNFAGFMHLEDELPGLVGERIWTETRHIEQKLLDITEHMETVIQKYLRNEFTSIDEYNVEAGEIAEPYRFLVIADFPANFHDESARRLASILSSGPRCGVFTLLLRDRRLPIPERFDIEDISRHAISLLGVEDKLIFDGESLDHLPFTPVEGPPDDLLIEISRRVGKAAREAGKVEVPFETIAPQESDFWTASSDEQLHVALGRAGATKLQYLNLGIGTSQHALIAGKTGSGKSTLLHALITNLACWYSPEEVEFYLVDFKKGVEFKTYATHGLPHARAVAVESDREFGLSVLHGLDEELKRRGELFRDAGTQDLAAWRRKTNESMPRVLLVIDEFQELFIEDDKVSQDAALLLDRLVRQGRAFGMHVLLGSQTLGGAYSLHRSTMGQMGVRIALQCNEQDSMLILSDDNVAARLLARPGEAIYNDQGGLMEGNSPFQVCWLPDAVRERYLANVAKLAKEKFPDMANRCIVFEGNAPASLTSNAPLRASLENRPTESQVSIPLWLGDAVAIKDPTCAFLRRQAGGNVVIVGQQDENALATTTACMISAASVHKPEDLRFVVLDGTPTDDPNAGYLHRAASLIPHQTDLPGFRDSGDAVLEVATELAKRIDSGKTDENPIILLIHGLHRFRSLRRDDDDFGFSTDLDAPMTADKAFGQIIKEGPEFGVFTVAWCDTVPSLERAIDRQGMRGFDYRAMFQVSATDSSTLIDSPAAGQLGSQRGLLYSEERGTIEKFRPWALPGEAMLAQIATALGKSS